MVPGGNPFFLYLTSFHFSRAVLTMLRTKNTARITTKTAIALQRGRERERGKEIERAVKGMEFALLTDHMSSCGWFI